MQKSLVTGGAGFIGSHIVEALSERGDLVRVLDNYSTGNPDNLKAVRRNIEIIEGDLQNSPDVRDAVQGIDTIFHLAAFVSVPQSMEDPVTCYETNVNGTIQLFKLAEEAGVKRVVIASSAAVYGENPALPLSESAATIPLSPYAASKRVGEIYTKIYSDLLNLDIVALRFFNIYGPRQNPNSQYAAVIPIFIKKMLDEEQPIIYGDGLQSRDFVYIDDVVRANLLAAESSQAPGQVINICSGIEINLLQLVDSLSSIFNREVTPEFRKGRPGDIYRSFGDPTLAGKILNFTPAVNLETGVKKTVSWMDQHPQG
ncbi:MAG: NAD-dependent epimerase/dehydratase family protein [Anaerolineales bacterium]|nr:NAD-dependent epimerase/dehydratase family protein [Anaerolineales bacterium]